MVTFKVNTETFQVLECWRFLANLIFWTAQAIAFLTYKSYKRKSMSQDSMIKVLYDF